VMRIEAHIECLGYRGDDKNACLRLPETLFETMVYHTDRARRLALTSPLLLPERVPVVFSIRLFGPPSVTAGFFMDA
jgi:hypothetical protein